MQTNEEHVQKPDSIRIPDRMFYVQINCFSAYPWLRCPCFGMIRCPCKRSRFWFCVNQEGLLKYSQSKILHRQKLDCSTMEEVPMTWTANPDPLKKWNVKCPTCEAEFGSVEMKSRHVKEVHGGSGSAGWTAMLLKDFTAVWQFEAAVQESDSEIQVFDFAGGPVGDDYESPQVLRRAAAGNRLSGVRRRYRNFKPAVNRTEDFIVTTVRAGAGAPADSAVMLNHVALIILQEPCHDKLKNLIP
eukprot:g40310.t1